MANENYIGQTGDYVQMLIVDLDNFKSDKFIETLSNAENSNCLNGNNIFNNDIYFTQDFSGLIKKEEIIDYLMNIQIFRKQGSYGLETHTILGNDFIKSRNCLKFMKVAKIGDVRCKL